MASIFKSEKSLKSIITFTVGKEENGGTNTKETGSEPIKPRIFISRNGFSHQHNWDDLASLESLLLCPTIYKSYFIIQYFFVEIK